MVRAQKRLLDYLEVKQLLTVAGGSMGGMQALAWCQLYPDNVLSAILIATAPNLTAQGIAWNEIGRRAIMADQAWDNGNYYAAGHSRPEKGLAVARSVAHITYLSELSMSNKFGRRLHKAKEASTPPASYKYGFDIEFEVESYLAHQGASFNRRFDANSYLYITRAMDYFDMTGGSADLVAAFTKTKASYLFISFDSDWLYPPERSQEMFTAAQQAGKPASYLAAQAPYGHDSFLLDATQQAPAIQAFLLQLS
jgi:homoserine O-acetyltransferase